MHFRNSGLSCGGGYSCGCGGAPVNPTPSSSCGCSRGADLGALGPTSMTIKYPTSAAAQRLVRDTAWYFREGIAFGAAWTASLEQNVQVAAQWSSVLESNAISYTTLSGASASGGRTPFQSALAARAGGTDANRFAFTYGFDLGIRIVFNGRGDFRDRKGRVYTLAFLRAQGLVAANTLFGQTRPAVLSSSLMTSAPPMPVGTGVRSTYTEFVRIAR